MKLLLLPIRLLAVVVFSAIIWTVFFYDASRELLKKRRLGNQYEGPAEDWPNT